MVDDECVSNKQQKQNHENNSYGFYLHYPRQILTEHQS